MTAEVADWLTTMKMEKYAHTFIANQIDGATLVEMNRAALAELGASAVDQAKIIASVKKATIMPTQTDRTTKRMDQVSASSDTIAAGPVQSCAVTMVNRDTVKPPRLNFAA